MREKREIHDINENLRGWYAKLLILWKYFFLLQKYTIFVHRPSLMMSINISTLVYPFWIHFSNFRRNFLHPEALLCTTYKKNIKFNRYAWNKAVSTIFPNFLFINFIYFMIFTCSLGSLTSSSGVLLSTLVASSLWTEWLT